jgi:PilZ domain
MSKPKLKEVYPAARRDPRVAQLREIHMTYEGTEDRISLHPPDISARGMFINTAVYFPEGAVVNLRFRLNRSDVEVQTRGEVRYCMPGIGIGVEFIDIAPEAIRAIETEVKASNQNRRRRN